MPDDDGNRPIPAQARLLGATGAIPFLAFVLGIWFAPPDFQSWSRHALIAYGMVILSFVGALHWGFTMKTPGMSEREQWTWMGWSVIPALAAWGAGILPYRLAIALLVVTFVVHLALDHKFAPVSGLPAWYLRLRRRLTVVVVVCLILGGVR